MVVSLGMTLVIAVRGLDISVGAVVAIAAAVAALMIGGSFSASGDVASNYPLWLALGTALAVAAACGLWNGLLVVKAGMQPIVATLILMVAGRGIAQLLTGGQIITVYYPPFFTLGNGFLLGLPVALWIAAAAVGRAAPAAVAHRARALHPRHRRQSRRRRASPACASSAITLCVYTFCGLAAGVAGLIISSNVKSADANNAGQLLELDAILAVTLGGTALTGGRFSLAGTVHRRADHPDADLDDLFARRAAGSEPGGEGRAGVRRHAAAVGRNSAAWCCAWRAASGHDA